MKGDELAGDLVFELYDTFGFPVDLTALIASEQELKVDEAEFSALLEAKNRSARPAKSPTTGKWSRPTRASPNSSGTTTPLQTSSCCATGK